MKKLIGSLIVTTLLSAALITGCSENKGPSSPGVSTPTSTGTIVSTFTRTATRTFTRTVTNSPTSTPTGTLTPSPTATTQPVQAPVNLGNAGTFAILAFSTIVNSGSTTYCGDLGLYPGTSVTGSPVTSCVSSVYSIGPAAGPASMAQADLALAYADAQGRLNPVALTADIGGQTLFPGLYMAPTSLGITGTLTLDAQNSVNNVFIIQVPSTLTAATGSQINLINGAVASHVYWQVGSSATLNGLSTFSGIIMAHDSITMLSGATLAGRALAMTAAGSFDTNIITAP